MSLTSDDRRRYARQLRLPDVGDEGQERLQSSSALVIGAGGLGSPALHHLVASGVGTVGIVEFDRVDISNLHRQTLYASEDVGREKIEAAASRLHAINPDVEIRSHSLKLTGSNADDLLRGYDVVLDGSDTFATRYAVNDASVRTGTPNVFASVNRFSGQASVFGTETGPCYRCLFPEPPPPGLIPNCEEGGVLGVVPSLLGTIQAAEALKLLLGIGSSLAGRLLLIDVLSMEVREIQVERDPACPVCGTGTAPLSIEDAPEITVQALRQRLGSPNPPALLDVREGAERAQGHIGGRLLPLGQLEARAFELDDLHHQDVVVYCKSGARSGVAARWLRERGYRAVSLRGGIDAWDAIPVS